MNKLRIGGWILVVFLQLKAMAGVAPALIKVESDQTNYLVSYVVPQDKILIIDAIQSSGGLGLEFVATNGVVYQIDFCVTYFSGGQPLRFISLERGVKISGGTMLRGKLTGYAGTNSICIYGSLVDAEDLYARVAPSLMNLSPMYGNGGIAITALAGNEAIIRVEQTDDAMSDDWAVASTFATGANAERTVSLPTDGSARKFYRLRTLAR